MKRERHFVRTLMGLIVFAALVFTLFENPTRYAGVLSRLWSILGCITGGFCVAFILNLIMNPIERLLRKCFRRKKGWDGKEKLLRGLGVVLTLLVTFGAVALLLILILPHITQIVELVVANLPLWSEKITGWMSGIMQRIGVDTTYKAKLLEVAENNIDKLTLFLTNSLSTYANSFFTFLADLLGGMVDVLLAIVISVYVLCGKEKVSRVCRRLMHAYLPERAEDMLMRTATLMYEKFAEFFKGQLIESLLLGGMCFIGMVILRIPSPAMISVLVGVSALIPIVGPWVGTITGVLLTVVVAPFKGLLLALFIFVLQQVEDNVIYPRIVGKRMGIPGLVVMCAVVVGGGIGGVLGIVVAVPLSAVILEIVEAHSARRAQKKESRNHADAD